MGQGLFENVKNSVNIRPYIETETGSRAKRTGDGTYRINPCPFCSHNDCFTINETSQYYHCFSCNEKGDLIQFEQRYRKLSTPREAAEEIARKQGIAINGRAVNPTKKQTLPPPDQEPAIVKTPAIDEKRAAEIRDIVATYYHGRLLADEVALRNQTEKRKHSFEVLKELRVGLGGGNLIGHCKEQGITVEELLAVGVVRSQGRGFGQVAGNGRYVYPHMAEGNVVHFSFKDPEGKRKWQIRKDFVPKEWVCWGQEALGQDEPVIIVEGENDRISVLDRGGYPHVIATIGAYNEARILDVLKSTAKGKEFFLAFDEDPSPDEKKESAGKRYTRKYADAILEGGGKARVIVIALGEGGIKRDIDDVLKEAQDPRQQLRGLMESATAILKVSAPPAGKKPDRGPKMPPEAYRFSSFEVLGELKNDEILYWSKVNQKLYIVPLKESTPKKLVQIGGEEVAKRVSRGIKDRQDGQVVFSDLEKRIIVEAGKKQLGDPDYLGQGIHRFKKGLVVVVGGDAWVWDGRQIVLYPKPIIDGNIIRREKGQDWVDFDEVKRLMSKMDSMQAKRILHDVIEWFFQWEFRGQSDKWLLVGWVLAQYIQCVWPWRPHLWLIGSAESGKTLMVQMISNLGGKLALPCEGQNLSEPGLRQNIGDNACLVTIDEFEKGKHREDVIDYIRSAGRGGYTRKGTADQRGMKARLQHMIFLSSVEKGLKWAAELTRYLVVETRRDRTGDVQPRVVDKDEAGPALRVKVVAYCLWAAPRVKKMIRGLKKRTGVHHRFVESLAVVFSMIAVCEKEPKERLEVMIDEYLREWGQRGAAADMMEDEERLLRDILGSKIHPPISEDGELRSDGTYGRDKTFYSDRTIEQLIDERDDGNREYQKILQAHGIKIVKGGVFIQPALVSRHLLRGTQWQDMEITDILKRLDGVISGRKVPPERVDGVKKRGLLVPWNYFTDTKRLDVSASPGAL